MTEKKRLSRASLVVLVGIPAVAVILVSFGMEIYLRHRRTHIVAERSSQLQKLGLELQDPELLMNYTPKGRRHIPYARVLIKNEILTGRDIPMRTNSLGFRGGEIPSEKRENESRILVLGDSITAAHYLLEEETYVQRIHAHLSPHLPDRRLEVMNGGVEDTGIKEAIDILTESGISAQPDIVVVGFYLNDSRPPWGFPGELRSNGWLRQHSLLVDTLYRNLKLAAWFKKKGKERFEWADMQNRLNWRSDRREFEKLVESAQFDWGAAWQPSAIQIARKHLSRLAELSAEHGFKVAIAVFPVSFQVYSEFLDDTPQRTMESLSKDFGFAFVDLLPELRKLNHIPDLFYDNCHPRPLANDRAGYLIAELLRSRFFQEPRSPLPPK